MATSVTIRLPASRTSSVPCYEHAGAVPYLQGSGLSTRSTNLHSLLPHLVSKLAFIPPLPPRPVNTNQPHSDPRAALDREHEQAAQPLHRTRQPHAPPPHLDLPLVALSQRRPYARVIPTRNCALRHLNAHLTKICPLQIHPLVRCSKGRLRAQILHQRSDPPPSL